VVPFGGTAIPVKSEQVRETCNVCYAVFIPVVETDQHSNRDRTDVVARIAGLAPKISHVYAADLPHIRLRSSCEVRLCSVLRNFHLL
jgi:hypothetical protein